MQVKFENVNLEVREDSVHEWLLETALVADGYGITENSLRSTKSRNEDELVEGKHYLVLQNATSGQNRNQIFWTKKGVVRLGFFIKSAKAKSFRDWAEDLIVFTQSPVIQSPLLSPKELAMLVIRAEEDKERLLAENARLAPKANYTDVVLRAEGCHTVTSIAKELGMSGRELNRQLCEAQVQYRHREHYVLYAKYQNKGYTETETHPYFNSKGEVIAAVQMVWTEYGRVFVHSLFNRALSFSRTYNAAVAIAQKGGVVC
jgi:anti-repressor protein